MNKTDEEIIDIYIKGIKKIDPTFAKKNIIEYIISRTDYASPVFELNHSKTLPTFDTPVKNSVSMASAGIFSIGFLKETYDRKQPNNHSCRKDLTADFFGIVLGAWLWLAVTGD